jgi:uncharacterized protein YjiS (DUF1127 family)
VPGEPPLETNPHRRDRVHTVGRNLAHGVARDQAQPPAPRRELLERIRETAHALAGAARSISQLSGISATRVLDDIGIEAAAVLMRSRWKPPMWGPPGTGANPHEAAPTTPEKKNERT